MDRLSPHPELILSDRCFIKMVLSFVEHTLIEEGLEEHVYQFSKIISDSLMEVVGKVISVKWGYIIHSSTLFNKYIRVFDRDNPDQDMKTISYLMSCFIREVLNQQPKQYGRFVSAFTLKTHWTKYPRRLYTNTPEVCEFLDRLSQK